MALRVVCYSINFYASKIYISTKFYARISSGRKKDNKLNMKSDFLSGCFKAFSQNCVFNLKIEFL